MTLRGMSFIDVVVGTGVMLTVFLSIFGAYRLAIDLVYNTKARVGGVALVTKELEYLRSLPYDSLGTVGGIPAGAVPQLATTTLNNIPYTVRTLILYRDDPADGSGGADSNSITADYKEIKVEALWQVRGRSFSTSALTRVAPHGIESLTSGGTLRVNVFDALAAPVQGASVRIVNASTSPTIDVTVLSDAGGSVALPGAPQASNYKITVSKDGYSSAQTYDITTQNPNPNPAHISVANQQTTTISFAIDRVGTMRVTTLSPIDVGAYQDLFPNAAGLAATTSVVVLGGEALLEDSDLGYPLLGEARSIDVAPEELASWDEASWSATTPPDTALRVHVVYPTGGSYALVPDAVLAGNSAGFTSGLVTLSALSTSTFPSLALRAVFETTNASSTPTLEDWRVDYHAGPSPVPNVSFTIYGTKTIGTSISGAPIYKFVQTNTTASDGSWLITPIEWDTYTMVLTGSTYDVSEVCPSPVVLQPGADLVETLLLVPKSSHSLRVEVAAGGVPLPDASVTVTNPGNKSGTTSSCGQAFFSGLSASDYTVTVTKQGYQDSVQSVSVAGASVVTVPLVP